MKMCHELGEINYLCDGRRKQGARQKQWSSGKIWTLQMVYLGTQLCSITAQHPPNVYNEDNITYNFSC